MNNKSLRMTIIFLMEHKTSISLNHIKINTVLQLVLFFLMIIRLYKKVKEIQKVLINI